MNKLGTLQSCERSCFPSWRLGLHISIHTAQFHHGFTLKARTRFLFLSGYESAWLNGFSILLFIKREYLSPTRCNVKVQSVIASERSVGTHQTVSPQTRRDYMCVSSLFRDIQQHLAIVIPLALLYGDKCCVINFLKLHLLNYALHRCDLSCSFFLFFFIWGGVQLGRYEATEILRQKDIWLAQRAEKEKVIEREKKEENTQGKGGGWRPSCSPPPPQTSPHWTSQRL